MDAAISVGQIVAAKAIGHSPVAQIEQGNIDPGALGDTLLLPVMLALQRPGDGNLTIARALRVGIAADHAGERAR